MPPKHFACIQCARHFTPSRSYAGKQPRCPRCRGVNVSPEAQANHEIILLEALAALKISRSVKRWLGERPLATSHGSNCESDDGDGGSASLPSLPDDIVASFGDHVGPGALDLRTHAARCCAALFGVCPQDVAGLVAHNWATLGDEYRRSLCAAISSLDAQECARLIRQDQRMRDSLFRLGYFCCFV